LKTSRQQLRPTHVTFMPYHMYSNMTAGRE